MGVGHGVGAYLSVTNGRNAQQAEHGALSYDV